MYIVVQFLICTSYCSFRREFSDSHVIPAATSEPSPLYDPETVVQIQLKALKYDDLPTPGMIMCIGLCVYMCWVMLFV